MSSVAAKNAKPNTSKGLENPDDYLIEPIMDQPAARLGHVRHELGQHKGVNISIEVSDTFAFDSPQHMTDFMEGKPWIGPLEETYIYSRSFNPTVEQLGLYLAALEATESAYCTSSGMSAITAVMIHLCKSGGHVVAANTLYGGTANLLSNFLVKKCNINTTFVDITDLEKVNEAMIPGKTAVLYFETVANPAMVVANIPMLSRLAHEKDVTVVVDNTFTPMILSPAKYGADVVIHSLTKFVSGGADIIAGAICGKRKLIEDMTNFETGSLMMLGPVMNPKEAFDLLGRLPHTSLRVKKQCNRTLKLAQRMKYELNIKVNYPGLEDHPQHELLDAMRNKGYGFGAVLCIDMETTDRAYKLLEGLKKHRFGFLAVSLGYYENLMSCPGALSDQSKEPHLSPGYIRLCVGYSGTLAQRWGQFKKAYVEVDAN